jgi:hypothetical protein
LRLQTLSIDPCFNGSCSIDPIAILSRPCAICRRKRRRPRAIIASETSTPIASTRFGRTDSREQAAAAEADLQHPVSRPDVQLPKRQGIHSWFTRSSQDPKTSGPQSLSDGELPREVAQAPLAKALARADYSSPL